MIVLPKEGRSNGSAIIVASGGGFMKLVVEHGGWNIAHNLKEYGFSACSMTNINSTLALTKGERSAFIGYVDGPQAQVSIPNVYADASDDMFF